MKYILDEEVVATAIDNIQRNPTDFMLLQRIPLTKIKSQASMPIQLAEPVGDEKSLAIIDIRATGTHFPEDRLIELAIVKVKYSPSQSKIIAITDMIDELEDPLMPIRDEISYLTGLTQATLASRRITEDNVAQILADRPLLVCHNAAQDRPFFDRRFPLYANLPWVCSLREVKWRSLDHNISSLHLKAIAMEKGYFYEAKQAKDDCLALLWLLNIMPLALSSILEHTKSEGGIIYAWKAPFDLKVVLKENHYRWDSVKKVWYKPVYSNQILETEIKFLAGLYDLQKQKMQVVRLDPTNKYKISQ